MSSFLLIDMILLGLAAVVAIGVISVRSLLSATMLGGIYSLLMALIWQNMNAVDVAFTEAAVGAGISTVLLVGTLLHTRRETNQSPAIHWPALLTVVLTGSFLIYGTVDMPDYGDASAPIHTGRVQQLLGQRVGKVDNEGVHHAWTYSTMAEQSVERDEPERSFPPERSHGEDHGGDAEAGAHGHPNDDFKGHSPNTVTSLLAAYRGYDTMYETAVIFTAGMAMVLLLRRREERA
ncbi:MAG: DUF4040 domain-containing protein [Planctomycetota bacterium]|nr:DUF4040 domain-containing protein [Planctomycetota bacterium]